MAADKYRHAEEEYFKLRGQFDTGRLSQDSFDEKLRELMVQDEQGRYWMLGADSGKWYLYDGTKWVSGDPFGGAAATEAPPEIVANKTVVPTSAPPPAAASPTSASPPAAPVIAAASGASKPGRSPVLLILIVVVLLLLAGAAFLVYQNRGGLASIAQQPTPITPVLPATITRAPSPTFLAALPTGAQPTLAPLSTSIPDTQVPDTAVPPTVGVPTDTPATLPTAEATSTPVVAVTVVVVTSVPPTVLNTPTLLPTVTNPPPPPTVTPIPATKAPTPVPPTNTPSINAPPGVYVTQITLDPPAPKHNQAANFTATFVNTTGQSQNYNWLIRLFEPAKVGGNKELGKSDPMGITVPIGSSQFTINYVSVKGPGGCVSLYAQAANSVSRFDVQSFPNTDGTPLSVFFDVCP